MTTPRPARLPRFSRDGEPFPDDTPAPAGRLTFEEFWNFAQRHPRPHEYIDGRVYPKAGDRLSHNQVITNITIACSAMVGDGPCAVYHNTVSLRIGEDVFCPDVLVVCEPGTDDLMVRSACVLVEVLSPTTARRDRTKKLERYRTLPMLGTYLIVSPRERRVEHHWRTPGGDWRSDEIVGGGEISLACPVGGVLSLAAIYRRLDVGPPRLRRLRERTRRPYAPGA